MTLPFTHRPSTTHLPQTAVESCWQNDMRWCLTWHLCLRCLQQPLPWTHGPRTHAHRLCVGWNDMQQHETHMTKSHRQNSSNTRHTAKSQNHSNTRHTWQNQHRQHKTHTSKSHRLCVGWNDLQQQHKTHMTKSHRQNSIAPVLTAACKGTAGTHFIWGDMLTMHTHPRIILPHLNNVLDRIIILNHTHHQRIPFLI